MGIGFKPYDLTSKNAIDGERGQQMFEQWFAGFNLPFQLIRTRPLIMGWFDLPEDDVRVSVEESHAGDYLVVYDGRVIERIEVSSSERDTKRIPLGDTKLKNFSGKLHALVDLRQETVALVHDNVVKKYVMNQTFSGFKLMPSIPINQIDPKLWFHYYK